MKLKEIKSKIQNVKKNDFYDSNTREIDLLQIDILYEILRVLRRIETTVDNIDHYLP